MRTSSEITIEQVIGFLVDAPMFGDLSSPELSQVVQIMQVRNLLPGDQVFGEGDPGDAWYVVFSGTVEVVKAEGDRQRVIAVLDQPACFGEMAILDGSPRSATVRAASDLTVLRFPRRAFGRLLEEGNIAAYKLVYQISLVLVSRQRRTTSRLADLLLAPDPAALRDALTPLVDQSSVAE